MIGSFRICMLVIGALLTIGIPTIRAQEAMSEDQLEGQIYAPDFPAGLDWLNTLQPLTMMQLHSKIVLINFWSMSSRECLTVMPELQKLREKYTSELFVIGIHSPTYENEKDSEAVRNAILRNEITFPVINDSASQLWNAYGMKSRPAFVLINPSGRVIGVHEGTGVFELFDGIIAQAITYFDADSLIGRHKISFIPEVGNKEQSLISYPADIVADTGGTRLFVSDSRNHRILAMTTSGKLEFIIGSGRRGSQDGSFTDAQFDHPQGLAIEGDVLYVADTEGHTIRAVNLKSKAVKTVVEESAGLKYPRDMVVLNGKLYITVEGANQIWVVELTSKEVKPFAGSGRSGKTDGTLLEAELGRPGGITTDGTKLYFVDSEGGAVRAIDPIAGLVETIVGTDLQNPEGITYHNGLLYVADSYNHQIKVIDPTKKTISRFAGNGSKGSVNGAAAIASFFEPAGLAVAGGKLFVADCNNQQVRVVDMATQKVSSLQITHLAKIAVQTKANFDGKEMKLPPAKLKSGAGKISIALMMPDGYRMLEQGMYLVSFRSSDVKVVSFDVTASDIVFNYAYGEFEIPLNGAIGTANVTIEIVVYMQKEGQQTCYYDMIRATVPVTIEEKGSAGFGVGVRVSPLPRM